MTHKIIRFVLLGLAAGLMLGAIAGCFGGNGEEEPEATEDLQATIDAAVAAASPTDTPEPEPTDTPVPPPPNIAATVAAALAANEPTAAPPTDTPVPAPTDTPVPAPTDTPVPAPTDTPVPAPTDTPVPAPVNTPETPETNPPCIIAGTVKVGGSVPPQGMRIIARSQANGAIVAEALSTAAGTYVMTISRFGESFDLYVRTRDSNENTGICSQGARLIKNLSVNSIN